MRRTSASCGSELHYGKGYRYAHDEPEGIAAGMDCLPPAQKGRRFYEPTDRGYEAEVRRRLMEWRKR